jgi:Leucine-rich repeat (LRR) protein
MMKRVDLQSNQLTGTIPTSIGNLTDMLGLHLAGNQLSGTLPSELGNLRKLQELTLNENHSLSGTIPTELAELSELGKFYMFSMMSGCGAL